LARIKYKLHAARDFCCYRKNVQVKYAVYIHVDTNIMPTLRHNFVTEQRSVVVMFYIFIIEEMSSFFYIVGFLVVL